MFERLHPLILFIIIVNILFSFKGFKNDYFFEKYKFNIKKIKGDEWIRVLSSGFLHVDNNHLFLNMLTLYFFGETVINFIGIIDFIIIYFGSLLLGNIISFYFHNSNDYYSAVGASGAIMGILFSSILLDPEMKLIFIFFPIPLPGYVFGAGYLIYTLFGMKSQNDSIGHTAHFGGAIAGILITILLDPGIIITSFFTLTLLLTTIIISGIIFFKK
ncbi:MAG: rhomboid family intramembrane serine protease [Flavobacteriaceae bacterium]|nr:rhomboid family intramembrane serine protease [Flavobacteriaceae bacterium]